MWLHQPGLLNDFLEQSIPTSPSPAPYTELDFYKGSELLEWSHYIWAYLLCIFLLQLTPSFLEMYFSFASMTPLSLSPVLLLSPLLFFCLMLRTAQPINWGVFPGPAHLSSYFICVSGMAPSSQQLHLLSVYAKSISIPYSQNHQLFPENSFIALFSLVNSPKLLTLE